MTPEEFVASFETVAEAPGGIKRLREMVLDLAMRGQLVRTDPKDEPASALVARLRQGPLTRERGPQSQATPVESPYDVKDSWQWCRFVDVASIESCLVDPAKFLDMPHVAPDNIEKGTGRLLPYKTIRQDGVFSTKHRFYSGQILYSKIRPNLSKVVVVDFEGLCSADMYPIGAKIDTRFLHLFMLSPEFLRQVVRDDNRLAMPKVNQQQLSETVVAVPPLAEQKRIVAKVDQLMALCDDLEARQAKKRETAVRLNRAALDALTTAEGSEEVAASFRRVTENFELLADKPESVTELRRAIIDLAISGHINPSSGDVSQWPMKRLADVVLSTRYGTSQKCAYERAKNPVLRIPNVVRGVVDLSDLKFALLPVEEASELALQEGDLLVVRSNGSKELVGRAAIVPREGVGFAYAGYLIRVRLPRDIVDPRWVHLALKGSGVRRSIERPIRTTSGVHNINTTELLGLSFCVPPVQQQLAIVAKVDQLMALCDTLEAALRRAESTAQKLAEAVVAELVA